MILKTEGMVMFNLFKKKTNEFKPTKEILEAAILKGKRIGLQRHEIIEMASMLDKNLTRYKVEEIVDKLLDSNTLA